MDLAQFIRELWSAIIAALELDAGTLQVILSQPNAGLLALCVVLLAGISKAVGDSVALFINHVAPRRFLLALVGGGMTFALELALWAISIWIIATIVGQMNEPLARVWLVVAIASAPWVFGFLAFAPYFGELVRWMLRIWSWLIVLVLLREVFGVSLAGAFVTATVGWLTLRALGVLFVQRTAAIYAWLWVQFTGTPAEVRFEKQAQEMALRLCETVDSN